MYTYALDSSVIIEMARQTPPEYYPSQWKNFDSLIESGRLVSLDVVYRELTHGNDWGEKWAKSNCQVYGLVYTLST